MNKKILSAAATILAALSLLGGATFAAFSDVEKVTDNTLAAGTVELRLTNGHGGVDDPLRFNNSNLAPSPAWSEWEGNVSNLNKVYNTGDAFQTRLYSAQNDGSIPANLSVRFENIVSSAPAFPNQIYIAVGEYPDGLNVHPASACHQAMFTSGLVNADDPSDTWALNDPRPLSEIANKDWVFDSSNPLEPFDAAEQNRACFRVDSYFPGQDPTNAANNNNLVQGATMSFDLRFDLVQAF